MRLALGIVGGVVALVLVAALIPTLFNAVNDVNTNLTDPGTTTGDGTADTLLPVFPILIGVGAIIAIVGAIFAAFRFGGGRD